MLLRTSYGGRHYDKNMQLGVSSPVFSSSILAATKQQNETEGKLVMMSKFPPFLPFSYCEIVYDIPFCSGFREMYQEKNV